MSGQGHQESGESLLRAGETVQRSTKKFWDGFSSFALQDNVLQVAVGLILAAAFTSVVTSFVSEIMLPPLSLIPVINRNFDEKFAVLRKGPHYTKGGRGYNTIQQAHEDGAVIMAYGVFVNKCVNFLGIGLALYLLALTYDWISSDSIIKQTVKCKYCKKWISEKAQRCVNCSSWQDGREDH